MLGKTLHRFFFIFGIVVVVIAIPFSPFLLSLGQFILAGNWLVELGFRRKFRLFRERKSIVIFISFYLIHVIWLFNSTNFNYAFHDLKIKLPFLVLPIIFGTTLPLNRKEIKIIFHFFIASILSATILGIIIFFDITPIKVLDMRSLSPVISHIRLALYIVLAIYVNISFLICNRSYKYLPSIVYVIILLWLILYILFLGALTGSIILFVVAPFALLFWFRNIQYARYKRIGISFISITIALLISYGFFSFLRYKDRIKVDAAKLEIYSVNGNRYNHFLYMKDYENKYPVWIYICEPELEKEWGKISTYKFEGKDKKGQPLKGTLIRYLTSLGYRKDSVGISKLDKQDIEMIQNGFSNYIYKKRFSLYPRLYQIFWEVENYLRYGNPSGHSLTQRIEYAKNALHVIKRHFWFGTGTGDVNDEIKRQYEIDHSILHEKWQLRTHNQLITFFLTFGLLGFTAIFLSIFYTLYLEESNIDFIAFSFLLIVLLSLFNEDTFETQVGATFFAFFFSLLILGRNNRGQ